MRNQSSRPRLALIAALTAALLTLPLAAEAARSPTGLVVKSDPSIQNGISVRQMAGRGAIDVWCAAGDHARRRLRAANDTELVLVRPSTGGGSTVVFQLGGQGLGAGLSPSVATAGESRSVAAAVAFCHTATARQQPDER